MIGLEPGTLVGRFVILAPLGAGGMGVVHLAYDPKLDRRIALKFLHERSANQTPRLLREAQALGRLSHPHVVAIHDVGTHGDGVWLAMEHVEGPTLAAWLGTGPTTRPWREVVDVVRAAGRGVVAVHAAGLVHRDLKPSNFMIGDDGRVRVMDFGLVRSNVADDASELGGVPSSLPDDLQSTLTRTGELLGTPAYMAPEQFLGRAADARTDQFSFCAVAWRALYGERPFPGESLTELRYAVIHGRRRSPPRGSKVPAWLRDVVARGLAVDPAARWPSMQALLDALASGRRRANVRRLAVGLVAIVALGGSAYAYQHWDRAREVAERTAACEAEGHAIDEIWNDETRVKLERALTAIGSPLATETGLLARQNLDAYASEWTRARTQLCIETEVEAIREPDRAENARSCFDEHRIALVEFIDIVDRVDNDAVGSFSTAIAGLQPPTRCLDEGAVASRSPVPAPELREQVEALRAKNIRIDILMQMRRLDTAGIEAEAALSDAQALGWPEIEAEVRLRLGAVKLHRAEPEAAAEQLEHALFLAVEHGHDMLAIDAAAHLVYLAYERGELADGLRWGRMGKAILARSELADLGLSEAHLHQSIGGLHLGRSAYDESIAEFRQTLAIYERLLPADHPDLAGALQSTCLVQSKRREYDDANQLCQRALDILDRSLPHHHASRGQALNSLAVLHLDRGAPAEALPYLVESLAIAEATLPAEHPDFGLSYNNLGTAYLDSGDPAKSLPEFERTLDLWTKVLPPDHPFMAYPLEGKGRALTELGKPAEAVAPLERALAMRSGESFDPLERAMTEYYLARALVSDPLTRPRALELARAALGTVKAADAAKESAKIEAWLTEQGEG